MEIFNYYGLDWAAMLLSVLAVWMLGNKNKFGFIVFIIANATWIALGATLMESYGIVLGNVFFLITNSRGFINWNRQGRDQASTSSDDHNHSTI